MVVAYIDHIRRSQANVEKILLLSKQHLIPFYTRCGFTYVGEGEFRYGWLYKVLIEHSACTFCDYVHTVMPSVL